MCSGESIVEEIRSKNWFWKISWGSIVKLIFIFTRRGCTTFWLCYTILNEWTESVNIVQGKRSCVVWQELCASVKCSRKYFPLLIAVLPKIINCFTTIVGVYIFPFETCVQYPLAIKLLANLADIPADCWDMKFNIGHFQFRVFQFTLIIQGPIIWFCYVCCMLTLRMLHDLLVPSLNLEQMNRHVAITPLKVQMSTVSLVFVCFLLMSLKKKSSSGMRPINLWPCFYLLISC